MKEAGAGRFEVGEGRQLEEKSTEGEMWIQEEPRRDHPSWVGKEEQRYLRGASSPF